MGSHSQNVQRHKTIRTTIYQCQFFDFKGKLDLSSVLLNKINISLIKT